MADDKPKTIKVLTIFFKNGEFRNFNDVAMMEGLNRWWIDGVAGRSVSFTFGPGSSESEVVGRGHAELLVKNLAGFAVWDAAADDPKPER